MEKIKALILIKLTEVEKNIFSQFKDKIDFTYKNMDEVKITREDISEAEIIIGYPPKKYLDTAINLKWLQMISSGVDKYMKDGIVPKQTIVTNAKGSYGESQSEFMFAMLISIMKKLHKYRDNQLQSRWKDEGNVMMLKGSTALVIGLGDIGTNFSKILQAFGVYVIGVRRDTSKICKNVDEMHSFKDLDSLVPKADIIAMVIPSTPETKNLMNAQRISMMKKHSVLVNTGRGATIDNEALYDAVENGHLLGAAVDVFENEPLSKDHRAWNIENLLITPHSAGQDYMDYNWQKTLKLIEENLKAYCNGTTLKNVIDRNVYEFKNDD